MLDSINSFFSDKDTHCARVYLEARSFRFLDIPIVPVLIDELFERLENTNIQWL